MLSVSLVLVVLILLANGGARALAQETIPFVPSPDYVVPRMLDLAQIKKGDVLYDMGSGDGRIVIEAAKKYGIRGVGIDLNVDLLGSYELRFGRFGLELEGQVLNAFNEQVELAVDDRLILNRTTPNPAFGNPTEVSAPRSFLMTAILRF